MISNKPVIGALQSAYNMAEHRLILAVKIDCIRLEIISVCKTSKWQ